MLTGLFIATKWFFNNNKNLCYHAGFVFIGVKPTLKVYIKGLAQMCDFALQRGNPVLSSTCSVSKIVTRHLQ